MSYQDNLFYIEAPQTLCQTVTMRKKIQVVHALHALQQSTCMKKIEIRTVDTDAIVILAGVFYDLLVIQPLANIWVAFGVGKN